MATQLKRVFQPWWMEVQKIEVLIGCVNCSEYSLRATVMACDGYVADLVFKLLCQRTQLVLAATFGFASRWRFGLGL